MKPSDTASDRALKKIMRGDRTPWGDEERSAWTRYVLSLFFRNPAAVELIKDRIFDIWEEGLKALEVKYPERRKSTDPATFEEYLAQRRPPAQIHATKLITEIIDNPRVGTE
jgi:hypothetical protein